MRISDWSSDVVLFRARERRGHRHPGQARGNQAPGPEGAGEVPGGGSRPDGEGGCGPAHARRTDTGRRRRRGGQVMELFTQGLSLGHYLALGAVLFCISVAGIFLNRKNVIILLMSIELMLLAVNINFVAFSREAGDAAGQVFVFFILTVAAAEAAIGLAILVTLFRNRRTINVAEIDTLKG